MATTLRESRVFTKNALMKDTSTFVVESVGEKWPCLGVIMKAERFSALAWMTLFSESDLSLDLQSNDSWQNKKDAPPVGLEPTTFECLPSAYTRS